MRFFVLFDTKIVDKYYEICYYNLIIYLRGGILDNISVKLPKIEQIPIILRNLYERYGYTKYRMAKFEPYDFYREHKGFLKSEGILTFNGPNGKLLALKPDVTMSIAKSVKKDKEYKYFYLENVYRTDGVEYNEISQIGIEYIGGQGEYPSAEVLWLAVSTLGVISDSFALSIGHVGVWNKCFEELGILEPFKSKLLEKIKNKSMHEVKDILSACGVDSGAEELILKLASVSGKLTDTVKELRELTKDIDLGDICQEIEDIASALKAVGADEKCYLDFSVMGDLAYYNGIIFNGYVEGVSKATLSGGRYDNLLKSMNKNHKAIGFAVYTEELQRALQEDKSQDSEIISVCGKNLADALLDTVKKAESGEYVKAVTEVENA